MHGNVHANKKMESKWLTFIWVCPHYKLILHSRNFERISVVVVRLIWDLRKMQIWMFSQMRCINRFITRKRKIIMNFPMIWFLSFKIYWLFGEKRCGKFFQNTLNIALVRYFMLNQKEKQQNNALTNIQSNNFQTKILCKSCFSATSQ